MDTLGGMGVSHPSRGAWVEMKNGVLNSPSSVVAPLTGCVGWNNGRNAYVFLVGGSHPSRGAWVEITIFATGGGHAHKSHPSRGAWVEIPPVSFSTEQQYRRTPHGVRGLKYAGL